MLSCMLHCYRRHQAVLQLYLLNVHTPGLLGPEIVCSCLYCLLLSVLCSYWDSISCLAGVLACCVLACCVCVCVAGGRTVVGRHAAF
jgi:hypothetical protein